MEGQAATPCPDCQRLRAQVAAFQAQLEALQATVAQLQGQLAQARKDSSTSSKPPSSDLVKPPKAPPRPTALARRATRPSAAPTAALPARVAHRRLAHVPPGTLPRLWARPA